MRYLIISDIHGCLPRLQRALDYYRRGHFDMLLILGDILNYGPRNSIPEGIDAKGIVEVLNPMAKDIVAVRGNCDAEVDQMLLDFPVMADYALIVDEGRKLFLTHGHVYNTAHLPPLQPGDILLHGHTHVPAWEKFGQDNYYLNPGSVSIPKENSPRGYMTVEDGAFAWKTLAGEVYHTENF